MKRSRCEKLKARNRIPIPSNLELPDEMHDQIAKLAFLLLRSTSQSKNRKHKGHYFPFSNRMWRSFFGGDWSKVKKKAVQIGLIEENKRYKPGKFSKSLRLSSEYRDEGFRYVELRRKFRASSKKVEEDIEDPITKKLVQIMRKIDMSHVEVPENSWEAIQVEAINLGLLYGTRCEQRRLHTSFTILPKRIRLQAKVKGKAKSEFTSIDVKNSQPLLLSALMRKEISNQRSQTPMNKRYISSPLRNNTNQHNKVLTQQEPTNIEESSTLQESYGAQCQRAQNERAQNDRAQNLPPQIIGDCHGVDLALFEDETEVWAKLCETGGVYEVICKELKSRNLDRPAPQPLRITCRSSSGKSQRMADVAKYGTVNSGYCSDRIISKAGVEYIVKNASSHTWNRSNVKKAFIVYLFSPVSENDQSPIDVVMRGLFPSIHKFLKETKSRLGYQSVARLLQATEAEIMIDGAAQAFLDRYPGVCIFPVHDEICVPTTHVKEARDIILECFAKHNLRPKLDMETAGGKVEAPIDFEPPVSDSRIDSPAIQDAESAVLSSVVSILVLPILDDVLGSSFGNLS